MFRKFDRKLRFVRGVVYSSIPRKNEAERSLQRYSQNRWRRGHPKSKMLSDIQGGCGFSTHLYSKLVQFQIDTQICEAFVLKFKSTDQRDAHGYTDGRRWSWWDWDDNLFYVESDCHNQFTCSRVWRGLAARRHQPLTPASSLLTGHCSHNLIGPFDCPGPKWGLSYYIG